MYDLQNAKLSNRTTRIDLRFHALLTTHFFPPNVFVLVLLNRLFLKCLFPWVKELCDVTFMSFSLSSAGSCCIKPHISYLSDECKMVKNKPCLCDVQGYLFIFYHLTIQIHFLNRFLPEILLQTFAVTKDK